MGFYPHILFSEIDPQLNAAFDSTPPFIGVSTPAHPVLFSTSGVCRGSIARVWLGPALFPGIGDRIGVPPQPLPFAGITLSRTDGCA
jgi:hypothetical protein